MGATNWRVVNLAGRRSAQKEFVVLDRYQGSRTGRIIIEVLTRKKPVFLDAIVARFGLPRVDFIKMDIEGSEKQALAGAAQTLKRFKPRMALAAYHKPEDPAAIPALV